MDYPPDLLDELARVFARVAVDRLLEDLAKEAQAVTPAGSSSITPVVVDGETPG